MSFKYRIGQVVYYRDGDRGWESAIVVEQITARYGHLLYLLDNGIVEHETHLR